MVHDVTVQLASLVAYWCATLLYGINVVVFFICIYVMVNQRMKGNSMPVILFCSTIAQFLLSTAHVALGLQRLIDSFIKLQFNPAAVTAYWIDPGVKTGVAANAVYITNTLIGDAIWVWRLYVVWNKNRYICVLPSLMIMATAGTGYRTIALFLSPSQTNIFEVLNVWTASFALTMATQALVTCAIAGRIWWISRGSSKSHASSRYFEIVWIIVESGAVYMITTILVLVFFRLKTEFGGIILNILAQTCAIVPTLTVIRVCLRRSYEPSTVTSYGFRPYQKQSTVSAIKFSPANSGSSGTVGVELVGTKGSWSSVVKASRVYSDEGSSQYLYKNETNSNEHVAP